MHTPPNKALCRHVVKRMAGHVQARYKPSCLGISLKLNSAFQGRELIRRYYDGARIAGLLLSGRHKD